MSLFGIRWARVGLAALVLAVVLVYVIATPGAANPASSASADPSVAPTDYRLSDATAALPSSSPSPTPSPMPRPTPTPTPTREPAGLAAAPCLAGSSAGPFLKTDRGNLTCVGQPLTLTGFTFYPALLGGSKAWHNPAFPSYIDHILDMGAAAGQNLIRPTDQFDRHATGQKADDPVVWANMDYLMTAAQRRGVYVVVDLSAFRWLLLSQGKDAANANSWIPFIDMVAARYKGSPALAFYSIAGEPTPPSTPAQLQTLLDFYRTTSQELRKVDPNHLISVGGFNHMEDHPELNWWQSIDALPTNDIVAVKTYSQHDLNLMPTISAYGRSVGKPVVDEEFGMPQGYGDGSFSGGAAYNGLSAGRAAFFESVYRSGKTLGFAGFIFWNMGCQLGSGSYEVNPKTPAVWGVVIENAAAPSGNPPPADSSLCP